MEEWWQKVNCIMVYIWCEAITCIIINYSSIQVHWCLTWLSLSLKTFLFLCVSLEYSRFWIRSPPPKKNTTIYISCKDLQAISFMYKKSSEIFKVYDVRHQNLSNLIGTSKFNNLSIYLSEESEANAFNKPVYT